LKSKNISKVYIICCFQTFYITEFFSFFSFLKKHGFFFNYVLFLNHILKSSFSIKKTTHKKTISQKQHGALVAPIAAAAPAPVIPAASPGAADPST
jgi:hypothetical protein